jgi:hypothetical protein
MTDWLHSVRTDGLPLHCIIVTLHTCIVVLHACIALYWLNVMLIVRHCSWIVPSVTFNKFNTDKLSAIPQWCITSDRICVSVFFCVCFFFFLVGTSVRTDRLTWLYATELKLTGNNWNLSVHPWHHSYIQTKRKKKNWNLSVHPWHSCSDTYDGLLRHTD